MALASAVKGARHTGQQITWLRQDDTAVNLTGTTLTGRLRDRKTGVARAIDGTLTLVTPASGIFNWVYGALDVGTAGMFDVQVTATYADTLKEISFLSEWWVEEAI